MGSLGYRWYSLEVRRGKRRDWSSGSAFVEVPIETRWRLVGTKLVVACHGEPRIMRGERREPLLTTRFARNGGFTG
jgi:hypothetical protein